MPRPPGSHRSRSLLSNLSGSERPGSNRHGDGDGHVRSGSTRADNRRERSHGHEDDGRAHGRSGSIRPDNRYDRSHRDEAGGRGPGNSSSVRPDDRPERNNRYYDNGYGRGSTGFRPDDRYNADGYGHRGIGLDDRHGRSHRYEYNDDRYGDVRPNDDRYRYDLPYNRHHDRRSSYFQAVYEYERQQPVSPILLQVQADDVELKFYADVMYLVSWEANLGPLDTWPYKDLSPRLKDCIDRVKHGKELGREGRAREEQEKWERRRLEWPCGGVPRRRGVEGWRERRGGYLTSVSSRYLDGRFPEPYRMDPMEIGGNPHDFGPGRERMLYSWANSRNQATERVGREGSRHGRGGGDDIRGEEPMPSGAAAGAWPRGWPRGWYERTAAEVDREY